MKKIAMVVLTIAMALAAEMVSFAGLWRWDAYGWWYEYPNKTYPANQWVWIDGNNDGIAECYYFDNRGYCLLDTTTADGYTVDINGAWTVNGRIQTRKVEIGNAEDTRDAYHINIPEDAFEYNGHYYYVYSNITDTWQEACDYCYDKGGYMAVINDEDENNELYAYMTDAGYTSAYFGYTDYDKEKRWKWLDDDSDYENWHSGEPNSENKNEDFAMFYWKYKDGSWNDGDFGRKTNRGGKAFICEWEPEEDGYDDETENAKVEIYNYDENGWLTDDNGWNHYSKSGLYWGHLAVDYYKRGTDIPVYAIAEGEVVYSAKTNGNGNTVTIQHNLDGVTYYSFYSHMKDGSRIKMGEQVQAGEQVGIMGQTGNADGPHVHLGIYSGPLREDQEGYNRKNGKKTKFDDQGRGYWDYNKNRFYDPQRFFETNGSIILEGQ